MCRKKKRVIHPRYHSPCQTPYTALRSLLSVALSSGMVKSNLIIPFISDKVNVQPFRRHCSVISDEGVQFKTARVFNSTAIFTLGACMIQAEYGYSDEEITLQIQENAYLQYFCGYEAYDDSKPPFDSSSMVYFRKRLTSEILGDINEMILSRNKTEDHTDDNDGNNDSNSGTIIVDATCAPSQIKYPQDANLLNQARKSTEQLIDRLHTPGENKPRTYRKRAYKDYLALVRCRKPVAKKIRNAIGKQLSYLRRNLESIEKQLQQGKSLTYAEQNRLIVIQKVYEQQKFMYDNHTHSVPDRIVSLSQPWVRPIVRGKAGKPVEFGAKLDISVVDGFTRLEYLSFNAYNEAGTLRQTIEKYRERTGHYPARVLADKIYRNRDNLNFCKEHGIRLSGPALGRPKKDEQPDLKQNYIDECERVEVERRFSLATQGTSEIFV